jgi:hypothetical protein
MLEVIDHLMRCWRMTGTQNTGETDVTLSRAGNGSAAAPIDPELLADQHDSGDETKSEASLRPPLDGRQARHTSDQEGASQLYILKIMLEV